LLLGKVPAPAAAQPFLTAIRGAKAQAVAQGKADDKSEARAEATDRVVTLTGCLQKGDRDGEFAITAHDGKTWELHSTSVQLDNHLGHTVTVTGPRTHETKAQEKAEAKREGLVQASSKEVYSELAVKSLKMVSETCK
jgi:hypothetical protein